jgi:hypothetical protein
MRADVMAAPLFYIDEIIQENHWQYLYSCSNLVHLRLVKDFYAYMEVVQDTDDCLTLQTTVRGVTIRVDAALITTFIRVPLAPYKGVLYPDSVDPPSMEEMIQFFDSHHHNRDRYPQSIKIGTFNSPHRLLAKIVLQNLWLLVMPSQLVLKRARFLYALIQRIPFYLFKHIVLTMLEMKDDHQVGLPFDCLVTRICQQFVLDIPALDQVTKPEDSFGKHTVMKSYAQLPRHANP